MLNQRLSYGYYLLMFALLLSGHACMLNPVEVTTGAGEHYYISNALCAYYIDPQHRYGLYVTDKGTGPSGCHFSAWVFNLSPDPLEVDIISLTYYKVGIANKHLQVPPNASAAIFDQRYKGNANDIAAYDPVSYKIGVAGSVVEGSIKLAGERHSSYMGTLSGCSLPANTQELLNRAEIYDRERKK